MVKSSSSGRVPNNKRTGRGRNGNKKQQKGQKRPSKEPEKSEGNSKKLKTAAAAAVDGESQLTPNAVRKLLLAEAYEKPVVVALKVPTVGDVSSATNNDKFVATQIFDKSFFTPCLITAEILAALTGTTQDNKNNGTFLVQVKGYVTSTVNASGSPQNNFEPFLALTKVEIVQEAPPSLVPAKRLLKANTSQEKIQGGLTSKWFHDELLPNVSLDELSGSTRVPLELSNQGDHYPEIHSNRKIVQDFLTHHKAMTALQGANLMIHHTQSITEEEEQPQEANNADNNANNVTNNSNSNSNSNSNRSRSNSTSSQNNNNNHTPPHQLYFTALKEFATAQMDRQKASLTSNAGRATAADAAKVVEQHKQCLQQVLAEQVRVLQVNSNNDNVSKQQPTSTNTATTPHKKDSWITEENLKQWHEKLCGNGLHAKAGEWRTKNVKAGRTVFCPASDVLQHLRTYLLPSLQILEFKLKENNTSTTNQNYCDAVLMFAAAVFFTLVDLHPFWDGNGRLARTVGNGALHLEFPFCINWFATPAQRSDYVLATLTTRRNFSLVYRGETTITDKEQQYVRDAAKASGLFFPLVAILMDRVRKAVQEFLELQHQKQLSALEHSEAVAARRVREREAAGSCLICFDEHPNIATLCCGRAVHLNCLAQWLGDNTSCPNCRGTMPALPRRPARNALEGELEQLLEEDSDDTEDELQRSYRPADLLGLRAFLNRNRRTSDDNDNEENHGNGVATNNEADDDGDSAGNDDDDGEDRNAILVEVGQYDDQSEDGTTTIVERDRIVIVRDGRAVAIHPRNNSTNSDDEDTTEDPEDDDGTTTIVERDRIVLVRDGRTIAIHPRNRNSDEDAGDENDEGTTEDIEQEGDETTEVEQEETTTDDTAEAVEDVTTDDTEETVEAISPSAPQIAGNYCRFCNNRPAQECTNGCCGRCCLLHGTWECYRHSG